MTKRIFISYSRKDIKLAYKIKNEIEERARVLCWIDLTGIESGNQFEHVIINAINQAELVLFFYSSNSVCSAFAEKEVRYAIVTNKPVIIINIDGSKLRGWPLFNSQEDLIFDYHLKESRDSLIQKIDERFVVKDEIVHNDSRTTYKRLFLVIWKYIKNPIYAIILSLVVSGAVSYCSYKKQHEDDPDKKALFAIRRSHMGANHYAEIYTWTVYDENIVFQTEVIHDKTECHNDPETGYYCDLPDAGKYNSSMDYELGNNGEFFIHYKDEQLREEGTYSVYFDIVSKDSMLIDDKDYENYNSTYIRYVNWNNLIDYYKKKNIHSYSSDNE